MAEKKFLDQGGLSRLWDKVKAYLTSWKTTNFGTGIYSNRGELNITEGNKLLLSSEKSEGTTTETSSRVTLGFAWADGFSSTVELTTSCGLLVVDSNGFIGFKNIVNKSGVKLKVTIIYVNKKDELIHDVYEVEPDSSVSVNFAYSESKSGAVLMFW